MNQDQDFIKMCYYWAKPIWGCVWYCQKAQHYDNWDNYKWNDMLKYGQDMFENCENAKKKSDKLSNLSPSCQKMKEQWDDWIKYCGIAGYHYNHCAYNYLHGNYQQAEEDLNNANGNIVISQDKLNNFLGLFDQDVPGASDEPPVKIPPGFNPITPPNFPTP